MGSVIILMDRSTLSENLSIKTSYEHPDAEIGTLPQVNFPVSYKCGVTNTTPFSLGIFEITASAPLSVTNYEKFV